jgi:hypothetical protein
MSPPNRTAVSVSVDRRHRADQARRSGIDTLRDAALSDDAMADNSALFKTISGYVNAAMLAALERAMTTACFSSDL